MAKSKNRRRRVENTRRSLPTPQKRFQATPRRSVQEIKWANSPFIMPRPSIIKRASTVRVYQTPNVNKAPISRPRLNKLYSPTNAGTVVTNRPEKTICKSRSERREVLHALRKTGKSGQKRPRWTEKSRIKCK